MKFFSPTCILKELLLLGHIEDKPNTTHKEMAKAIDGAPSMVNVYIDRLEENGFLVRDYKSAKIVYYNITSEGIKRKNYLSITHLHELLELYGLAEHNVEKFLEVLESKDYRNILLYGAGEVAETILRVIKGRTSKALKVLAIVDDSDFKKSQKLVGYKIISRDEIKNYEHDGIVITSYTYEDDITGRLEEVGYPMDRVNRFFSG